jgi:hypothetical protein
MLSKQEIARADELQARQDARIDAWGEAISALSDEELEAMSDDEVAALGGKATDEAKREDSELEELYERGYNPKIEFSSEEAYWYDPLDRD